MNKPAPALVILTPGFPASEADTTCLPMQQYFIQVLQEQYPGIRLFVLSFQYPYTKNVYTWKGIEVTPFGGRNRGGLTRQLIRRRVYKRLKEIATGTRLAGIISFWYGECAWMGKRFADRHSVRHLCWILGQDARASNKYPLFTNAGADELVALSDFLRDEFERNHQVRPGHVIPPGIDQSRVGPVIPEKEFDIIGVGSLIRLKRFDLFVELVGELKKNFPAIKALLVGDGPERQHLQKLSDECGLGDNLVFTRELPHAQVLAHMLRSRILLHPSSYEGFSGVCQEALCCGVQVISFCRAMKKDIDHWHIVNNREEMLRRTIECLQRGDDFNKSVCPYTMEDAVHRMMGLFSA